MITFITKPTDDKKLIDFYKLIRPSGKGWKKIVTKAQQNGENIIFEESKDNLPLGILCMLVGSIGIYSALFATGFWIYSNVLPAFLLSVIAIFSAVFIIKKWNQVIS